MNGVRPIVAVSVAGVALGAAYAVSPAGAASVVALAALIRWTARGLRGVERRWVVGWLTVAVAARVIAVAALPWLVNPQRGSFATLFGGDASYMIQRSIWIANAFVHAPFAPRDLFEAFEATYGWSGYTYVLAVLHVFFGASPYATHLISAVLFFAAVAVLFLCVRAAFGPVAAFAGMALVTVTPTLFAWSIAPLKEAPTYFLAALAVRATIWLLRPGRPWHMPAAAAAVAVLLWMMRAVRPESALLVGAALSVGAAGWIVYRHRRVAAAAAVTAVVLVLAAGMVPRARSFIAESLERSTRRHAGNVTAEGHSYALLDPGAYAFEGELTSGPRSVARFVVRSTVRFFTVPEPWLLKPGFERLILPQQMMWYAVVFLAGAGLLTALRRDALLTSLFAAFVAVGAVAIGLNSGNVGTLIRHRDVVVPFAMWLAAVGGTRAIGTGSRRFNTLDAAVIVVPVTLIAVGSTVAFLFRIPPPRPLSVTPSVIYSPATVVIQGRDLRPYLRALVMPTGREPETRDRHERSPEALYAIRTTSEAHLILPALPPGVYDFALFDGLDEVARLSPAFTVERMAGNPTGLLIVEGRFTRLNPAATVAVGDAVTSSDGAKVVEVLEIGSDRPDIEAIGPGNVKTWARLDGHVQRPATLRLRCTFATVRCYFLQQPVVADGVLALPFVPDARSFIIDGVRPDDPAWTMPEGPTSDAVVDFVGWPGAQQRIHAGDRDAGAPYARSLRPASIVRVVTTEAFVGTAALDGPLPSQQLGFHAPLIRVRAIVRFPRLPSGDLDFRGADVRAGSAIAFETPAYLLRGTIVNVLSEGGPRP